MNIARKKVLCTAISLACASLFQAPSSFANPNGLTVIAGQVSTQNSGNSLAITTSPGAILNWNQFSIAAGESTRFIQSSASSAVLNRVTGGLSSRIDGLLSSNGRVFLVNPQGIVVGPGGVIDTAAFVASTLPIADADWIAGNLRFAGEGLGIQNFGSIYSPHGAVALIAPNIENHGIISAEGGQIMLAAGHDVTLASLDASGLSVRVQSPTDRALNLGQLLADDGAISILAGTLKVDGIVQARRLSQDGQGQIILSAQNDLEIGAGALIDASSAQQSAAGSIIASAEGGTNWIAGHLTASNSVGAGGQITLTGQKVGLADTAQVEARGATGGGQILVGGGYRGENPEITNAERTYLAPGSLIDASATDNGQGGRIIVWSENGTQAYGTLRARGGEQGGDGGFIETSGRHWLDIGSQAPDVSAPHGQGGTWLLDPNDLSISGSTANTSGNGSMATPFESSAAGATIAASTLQTALGVQNVYVYASGNLSVDAALAWTSNFVLNLKTGNALTINANITSTGANSGLYLTAVNNITQSAGTLITPTLVANSDAGSINLTLAGNIINNFAAKAASNISLSTQADLNLITHPDNTAHSVYSSAGNVSLSSGGTVDQAKPIKANRLQVTAAGTVNLGSQSNQVKELSGSIAYASTPPNPPGNFLFRNQSGFTLVNNGSGSAVNIQLGGYSYDPSSQGGIIALTANTGSITQSAALAGAAVIAKANSGDVLLTGNNMTGIVAGSASGQFSYKTASSDILVSRGNDAGGSAHTGIQAGNISLEAGSAGNVRIEQNLNAGSTGGIKIKAGNNIYLNAGPATQTLNLTAKDITLQGSQIAFQGSGYYVTLTASDNIHLYGNSFDFTFLNNNGLATQELHIARADGGAMSVGGTCTNINACVAGELLPTGKYSGNSLVFGNNNSSEGPATTSINVASNMNWTGSGFLGLAAAGNIAQAAGTQITASKLGAVSQSGNITLTETSNSIGSFFGKTFGAGKSISLVSSQALVAVAPPGTATDLGTGINTNNGNVSLTGSSIALQAPISAGTGIVTLTATGGNLSQTSSGAITASQLSATASSGNIALSTATNKVASATLNAYSGIGFNNTASSLSLAAQNSMTGNISVYNTGDLSVPSANSVSNTAGGVSLESTGKMTLEGNVNGKTITLIASDIYQIGTVGSTSSGSGTTTVTATANTGSIILGSTALTQVDPATTSPSITYNAPYGTITALDSQFQGVIPSLISSTGLLVAGNQPVGTFATASVLSVATAPLAITSTDTTQTEETLEEVQQLSTADAPEAPVVTTTQRGFPQCAI